MTANRGRWTLLTVAAVAVVGWLAWWLARQPTAPPPQLPDSPAAGGQQVNPSVLPAPETVAGSDSRLEPVSPAQTTHLSDAMEMGAAVPARSPDDLPRTTPNATDQFTSTDIANGEMPVVVDFGDYAVQVGDEFQVAVSLTAPALKTLAIPLAFDPAKLAVVEGSAHEPTHALRGRLEFYARHDKGLIGLLVSGFPGLKNTHECNGEVVAVFKLRALVAGTADLELLRPGVQVVSATTDLSSRATINPPRIVIR